MISQQVDKQLPYGVADLFFKDAARKRAVEHTLIDTWKRWGYSEIIPPLFEYYESLAAEAGPQLRDEMYRFFDRDGRTLALRADFTIPVARIVGTKLYDRAMPLRFFYVGSVFRYEVPQAGVRREFTQAGIELIGASTPDADAEAIALSMTGLRAIGLTDFRFTLGNTAYLRALLKNVSLNETQALGLRDALRRKSTAALDRLLDGLSLDSLTKKALAQLPALGGGTEVLDRAPRVNDESSQALERLRGVFTLLDRFGLKNYVTFDLAENRGMAYYTGIIFEGFVAGLGFSVASGGRYDNLVAHFGPNIPSVGFAIGVERVLMALKPSASIAPDAIAEDYSDQVAASRAGGQIVEVDVLKRSRDKLREYARARGAREVWFRDGGVEKLS
jgi:ATP phosphoribosyltransferase regulatory subunit